MLIHNIYNSNMFMWINMSHYYCMQLDIDCSIGNCIIYNYKKIYIYISLFTMTLEEKVKILQISY